MKLTLTQLRRCFDSAIPATIATCAQDGTPNVAYLSQVHYLDQQHLALSFQFFNKTRSNILQNPCALLQIIDPLTAIHYRLSIQYLRTETEGPIFERMKAKLAGIASHTGMSKVFKLLGADVYQVLHIEPVPNHMIDCLPSENNLLPAVQLSLTRLAHAQDLASLLDILLRSLQQDFSISHAMMLMFDASQQLLYTVASCGYTQSGVGSEIPLGRGIVGVAAREKTPIRIQFATVEYAYDQAVRESLDIHNGTPTLEQTIPLPGLTAPQSQMALPIQLNGTAHTAKSTPFRRVIRRKRTTNALWLCRRRCAHRANPLPRTCTHTTPTNHRIGIR